MSELLCKNCGAHIELIIPGLDASSSYRHLNYAVACDLDDDASLSAEPK